MNKSEIHIISNYCNAISSLVNKINYGYEDGKYVAFFDINLIGWRIQVRKNEIGSQKVWGMELSSLYDITDVERELYKPTPDNFEFAIRKLRAYLNEMQEEEAVS